jgi:lysozyme family protein
MSVKFKPAFEFLMSNEGRAILDDEEGGEFSKFGITAKFVIDKGLVAEEAAKAFIKSLKFDDAAYIYEKYFWAEPRIDRLSHQRIATKVFDTQVNMGSRGVKILQECLGTETDGIIGPKTLGLERAVSSSDVESFLRGYANLQWREYQRIMEANPKKRKWAKGWEKRARKF